MNRPLLSPFASRLSFAPALLLLSLFGIVFGNAKAEWLSTGPYGGSAEVVRVNPGRLNHVLAMTRKAVLYESRNGGASWSHVYFPAQQSSFCHALQIHPTKPDTWFAGIEAESVTASGLYRTLDGGKTWAISPVLAGKPVWSLSIFPGDPRVMAAGTTDGVYLTEDEGANWRRISPENNPGLRPVVSVAFHPTNRQRIYAGTTHLPWSTGDGGATWTSIHNGMLDDSDVFSIQVESRQPEIVYASACSGVYRSADGGSLWARLPTPTGAFRAYLVAADQNRPGSLFAATSTGLLRSSDSGSHWRRISPHVVKGISFDPSPARRIYFASTTGGILLSNDGGSTVREMNAGFGNLNVTAMAGTDRVLFAGALPDGSAASLFRKDNAGTLWTRLSPAEGKPLLRIAVAPGKPDWLLAAPARGLLQSPDGGKQWIPVSSPGASDSVTTLAVLPGSSPRWFAGTASGLYRSSGADFEWEKADTRSASSGRLLLQSSGTSFIAAADETGAAVSNDAGVSWNRCGAPATGVQWYGMTAGDQAVFAATSHGLFRSMDNCQSWEAVHSGLKPGTVNAILKHPARDGEYFAAQYGKIFQSTDGGRRWAPLADEGRNGAYPSALLVLRSEPNRIFALFPGRGILSSSIPDDSGSKEQLNAHVPPAEK